MSPFYDLSLTLYNDQLGNPTVLIHLTIQPIIRLNAKPVNVTLCQVYAPTSAADEVEIETL